MNDVYKLFGKSLMRSWWPVFLGILVLYVPTFWGLINGPWQSEAYVHGPIILGLAFWLLARNWSLMIEQSIAKHNGMSGWLVCVFALLIYVLGRSQDILIFELGSFIPMIISILLIIYGASAVKVQWFPLCFMLFMIPLPGTLVDTLTLPMKIGVSYITEQILFFAEYPIARTGVILQIGQYKLMVADACAGLQTVLTLEALGLLYLNVVRRTSPFRNAMLAILIVPISFSANVIRVIVLTLITYHFGDAAGQGYLHKFAGLVLFMTALLLIIGTDLLLHYGVSASRSKCSMRERYPA